MAYWTERGLQRLAQSESGGRADLVHYPSGYTSSGVRSSASGLYGFLDSTWREQAGRLGVDTTQYPRAYLAPAEVQTYVAGNTPTSHWTCAGCNSVASNMAGNPAYVSGTPTVSAGYDPSSYGDYGGGGIPQPGDPGYSRVPDYYNPNTYYDPASQPGYDADVQSGSTGNVPTGDSSGSDADLSGGGFGAGVGGGGIADLAQGIAGGSSGQKGGLPDIGAWISTQLVRVALIGAGLVLIAAAAWSLAKNEVLPAVAKARA